MGFKRKTSNIIIPSNPEVLIREYLPGKKIDGLLAHQADTIREYVSSALKENDVAIQLPTGSGKTLVGLAIAEWLRIKYKKRVVYLCPNNQLANQVYSQAKEKYGMHPEIFTGKKENYSQKSKSAYENVEAIAITNYSSLFNYKPYFENPQIIVLDDAHAAENYISKFWTIEITLRDHAGLYKDLISLIKNIFSQIDFTRFENEDNESDFSGIWVEKLPNPILYTHLDKFIAIFNAHCKSPVDDLFFDWQTIRQHLHSCQVFFSQKSVLIRPLIPPTLTHRPFADASQRIYMSATIGNGGDLERISGVKKIFRVATPDGWKKQLIGRRFFLFPEQSFEDVDSINSLIGESIKLFDRGLMLTPSDKLKDHYSEVASSSLGCEVFSKNDLETSKATFIESQNSLAILANRYDGIDFPGKDCRLLFLSGFPRFQNIQETFFTNRLGCYSLFEDRILTRIIQSFGRCTRSPSDRSAVIVLSESFTKYLMTKEYRSYMHPELQSELEFGIYQSSEQTNESFLDLLKSFLIEDKDWQNADRDIINDTQNYAISPLEGLEDLSNAVSEEIDFQYHLWNHDYENASNSAIKVVDFLKHPKLRGYRTLWLYLAGSALALSKEQGNIVNESTMRDLFHKAYESFPSGINWLRTIANQFNNTEDSAESNGSDFSSYLCQSFEENIERLGTLRNTNFEKKITSIRKGLQGTSKMFEAALVELGNLIGYISSNSDAEGAPDPWWIIPNEHCIVFEAKNAGKEEGIISHEWLRQANSHQNWLRENQIIPTDISVTTIVLTKSTKIRRTALVQVQSLQYWHYDDFIDWVENVFDTLRKLRIDYSMKGQLFWRINAIENYNKFTLEPISLNLKLNEKDFNSLHAEG